MRFAITEEAGVELGLDQNLLELGLDSLRAAQFASQARPRMDARGARAAI